MPMKRLSDSIIAIYVRLDHPKKLLSKKIMHENAIKIVVALFLALFGKIVALPNFKQLPTLLKTRLEDDKFKNSRCHRKFWVVKVEGQS